MSGDVKKFITSKDTLGREQPRIRKPVSVKKQQGRATDELGAIMCFMARRKWLMS